MIRDVKLNSSEYHRLYRPMLFALLEGLTQVQGVKGEVLVMDVDDASILSEVALCDVSVLSGVSPEDRKGNFGETVFCVSRVKNVDFVGVETEDSQNYVEWRGYEWLPIEVIMPAVSYLTFLECEYEPSDLLEWDDNSATMEDAFVGGMFSPLINAIMQLCPNGIDQLISYMSDIGIIPVYPNEYPNDLQELMNNMLPPSVILDWLCQVALGKDIIKDPSSEDDEHNCVGVSSQSVQMLKDVLSKSGTEGIARVAVSEGKYISGYTYVTQQDANRDRHICLLGYYPVDQPKYGILVYLQRREQLQDVVRKEWPELGEYAASLCKRVIEILYN